MAFLKVGDLLASRRYTSAAPKHLADAMTILAAWDAVIRELSLTQTFERVAPLSFHNGILHVQAASAALASELKMTERRILIEYSKRFKSEVVTKIVIKR